MKIAFYHNLPGGGALRATERQLRELAKANTLDCFSLSCAPDVSRVLDNLCATSRVYPYELRATGRKGSLQPLAWLGDLKRMVSVQQQIADDINAGNYDLCLTVTCPYFEIPFFMSYTAVPTVYSCHSSSYPSLSGLRPGSSPPRTSTRNPFAVRLSRELAARKQKAVSGARMVVANSWFSREELFRTYGVDSHVLYLAVDTADFYPEPNVNKQRAVIGVGALAPFKAHDFSIRSVARIPEAARPEVWLAFHTEVAGEKDHLVRLAEQHGVKLKLYPNSSNDRLRQLYSAASATVFPSVFEPLGLVPLESMACGTPVVGVAEGGVRETVSDGKTGFLTHRDTGEFADAIARLLDNSQLAGEMAAEGIRNVRKNWTWERSLAQLESLLEKAVRHCEE